MGFSLTYCSSTELHTRSLNRGSLVLKQDPVTKEMVKGKHPQHIASACSTPILCFQVVTLSEMSFQALRHSATETWGNEEIQLLPPYDIAFFSPKQTVLFLPFHCSNCRTSFLSSFSSLSSRVFPFPARQSDPSRTESSTVCIIFPKKDDTGIPLSLQYGSHQP